MCAVLRLLLDGPLRGYWTQAAEQTKHLINEHMQTKGRKRGKTVKDTTVSWWKRLVFLSPPLESCLVFLNKLTLAKKYHFGAAVLEGMRHLGSTDKDTCRTRMCPSIEAPGWGVGGILEGRFLRELILRHSICSSWFTKFEQVSWVEFKP